MWRRGSFTRDTITKSRKEGHPFISILHQLSFGGVCESYLKGLEPDANEKQGIDNVLETLGNTVHFSFVCFTSRECVICSLDVNHEVFDMLQMSWWGRHGHSGVLHRSRLKFQNRAGEIVSTKTLK